MTKKVISLVLVCCIFSIIESSANASVVDQLSVEGVDSNYANSIAAGAPSASIGRLNDVSIWDSLAVGFENSVGGISSCGLVVGAFNTANSGPGVIAGTYNNSTSATWNQFIFGTWNTADAGNSSLISGNGNLCSAFYATVGGLFNVVTANAESSSTHGYGLVNSWPSCAVVGAFNISPLGGSVAPQFIVGNGTDGSQRSNALTVFSNGDASFQGVVRVAPGGDIPMFQ